MKIQWIGTAAAEGWPAVFCQCQACRRAALLGGKNIRTRLGAIIDDILLLDLNPDLYAQKLHFGLDLCRIRQAYGELVAERFEDEKTAWTRMVNQMEEVFAPAASIRTVGYRRESETL